MFSLFDYMLTRITSPFACRFFPTDSAQSGGCRATGQLPTSNRTPPYPRGWVGVRLLSGNPLSARPIGSRGESNQLAGESSRRQSSWVVTPAASPRLMLAVGMGLCRRTPLAIASGCPLRASVDSEASVPLRPNPNTRVALFIDLSAIYFSLSLGVGVDTRAGLQGGGTIGRPSTAAHLPHSQLSGIGRAASSLSRVSTATSV